MGGDGSRIGSSWSHQEPQRGVKGVQMESDGGGREGGSDEGDLEKNSMSNGMKVGNSKI